MITVISLLVGLLLYWAARSGWFGARVADFSTAYLATILCILGIRVVLTELGVRRGGSSSPRDQQWPEKKSVIC